MAEIDARKARSDAAQFSTIAGVRKLKALRAEHHLLADDGGLIDAFAEVFANISRSAVVVNPSRERSSVRDSEAGPRTDTEFEQRLDRSEETGRVEPDSKSPESAAPIQVQLETAAATGCESDEESDPSIELSDSDTVTSLVASPQVIAPEASGSELAPADGPRELSEACDVPAKESPERTRERQSTESSQLGVATHDASNPHGDPPTEFVAAINDDTANQSQTTDATSVSEPAAELEAVERSVDRRRQNRQPFNRDVNLAENASGNLSQRGAFKPQVGATPIPAEAAISGTDGTASSGPVHTATPTPQIAEAVTQLSGVAPALSGSNAGVKVRSAVKGLSPAADIDETSRVSPSPATGSTRGAKTSSSDIVARVKLIQRVSKAFQHLGADGGSVRIRLAPAELGSVRVEMQVHERRVKARVVAENESASTALREHLHDLRARLESFGMQVERLEVETETSDRGFDARQDANSQWQSSSQQRQTANRFTAASHSRAAESTDRPVLETPVTVLMSTNHGVDVRL